VHSYLRVPFHDMSLKALIYVLFEKDDCGDNIEHTNLTLVTYVNPFVDPQSSYSHARCLIQGESLCGRHSYEVPCLGQSNYLPP
jgi:hypothetical protein